MTSVSRSGGGGAEKPDSHQLLPWRDALAQLGIVLAGRDRGDRHDRIERSGDAEAERERLFDHMRAELENATLARPTIVVLDDLH